LKEGSLGVFLRVRLLNESAVDSALVSMGVFGFGHFCIASYFLFPKASSHMRRLPSNPASAFCALSVRDRTKSRRNFLTSGASALRRPLPELEWPHLAAPIRRAGQAVELLPRPPAASV